MEKEASDFQKKKSLYLIVLYERGIIWLDFLLVVEKYVAPDRMIAELPWRIVRA